MSRVTFLLPGSASEPVGGVKVAYEYANGLAAKGHEVTVVHSPIPRVDPSIAIRLKAYVRYPQRIIDKSYRPNSWMHVHPEVDVRWVPNCAERYIPRADSIIATAWKTAEWVARYGADKGKKFYLIQHQETWDASSDRVMATWRLPLQKIVISRWLQNMATSLAETSYYIPNGLDFGKFGVDVAIERRDPLNAMMLYHNAKWKGSADGLQAAALVHDHFPRFRLNLFGVPRRPGKLANWIAYHQRPPQYMLRRLYNDAAIFISPSWAEGWPLPPSEALVNGAALVCTDIGGHREYARHEQTALLSPPKNPAALAKNIERLCRDNNERVKLATAGNAYIRKFTWPRAVAAFERIVFGTNADASNRIDPVEE